MEYLETEWLDQEGLGLEPQCPLWSDALCTPTSSLSSTPEAPASQPHFLLFQRFWPEWSPGSFRRKRFCVTPSPAQQRWGLLAHRGRAPSFHHSPCPLQASHDQMSDPRLRGGAGRASSYCSGWPRTPTYRPTLSGAPYQPDCPPSSEVRAAPWPHPTLLSAIPLPSHSPSIIPFIHPSSHPPIHLYIHPPPVDPSFHPFNHLSILLSIHPSIPIH